MRKKEATTITPSALFKPNELFIQTTFIRVCKKRHDLSAEQAERVFQSAKAAGILRHSHNWGAVAGTPVYIADKGTIAI